MSLRKSLSHSSLSWFFGLILILTLIGQALTGVSEYNQSMARDGLPQLPLSEYVTSSQFAVDVAENWQSEYLQFLLYIVLTVWLVQRGSTESKAVEDRGVESDEEQQVGAYADEDSPRWARVGGWRQTLYSNSLGIVVGLFFFGSWGAQLVAGTSAYNSERLQNLQSPVSMGEYFGSPDFWNRTLQNWQSEFLAVGSMVVLSIYLRQRGSPESKPVGASHAATGVEG
jgi:hypothetical protein